ncbi:MAG: alpha/beta hydrolase [Pseudomonadota bacterium]
MHSYVDFGHGAVPWLELDGADGATEQQTIHLSPANGIPVASYASFIESFPSSFHFTGMDCRGAWPGQPAPNRRFNWHRHADDLIAAIESKHTKPVIGMGHSLGGTVTALAASKRPELFSRIIIIDPASLPSKYASYFYDQMPQWVAFRMLPFIRRTHARQRIWSSREAFVENYRNHPTYKNFTDRALLDYAQAGLQKREDGRYELVFNPEWESFNFRRVYFLWAALQKVSLPVFFLRAENTYLYSQERFTQLNQSLGDNVLATNIPNSNHLVTHENPEALSKQIQAWLAGDLDTARRGIR